MWHKHSEKFRPDPTTENIESEQSGSDQFREMGKRLADKVMKKEETRLGRPLTPEEKLELARKSIRELLHLNELNE